MGTYLDRALGKSYAVVGLVSLETAVDWRGGEGCGLTRGAAPNAVERQLSGLGHDYLLVDLRSPAQPPFFQPGRRFELGRSPGVAPGRHFDGLIYLETSPKMTPLAWPPC